MLKKLLSLAALAMLCGPMFAAPAHAATINFEAFSDGQNINGLNLGGVTLTATGGVVEIFSNGRFGASFNSPVNAFSTPNGTGTLTGVFDAPTSFVSLYAGDEGGDTDSWRLEVFDAVVGGNSLGSLSSGDFSGSPYSLLAITASNILRFEATWTGLVAGVAYDDLSFDSATVPEPGSLALLGLSLAGLAAARRRKH